MENTIMGYTGFRVCWVLNRWSVGKISAFPLSPVKVPQKKDHDFEEPLQNQTFQIL